MMVHVCRVSVRFQAAKNCKETNGTAIGALRVEDRVSITAACRLIPDCIKKCETMEVLSLVFSVLL